MSVDCEQQLSDELGNVRTHLSPIKAPYNWLAANVDHIRSTWKGFPILSTVDLDILGLEKLIYPRFVACTVAHLKLHAEDDLLANFSRSISTWIHSDEITLLQNHRSIKDTLWAFQYRFRNNDREENSKVAGRINKLMQLDILSIATRILAIINDDQRRKLFLAQRGPKAQTLLDLLQEVINVSELDILRPPMLAVILKLSKHSGLYPASLVLQGISPQGRECVFGGSYGDIWAGKLGETAVAIKVTRVNPSHVKDGMKAFCKEAIVWRQLYHPNVLPFYGVWRWTQGSGMSSRFCLVSPWMENGNIIQYLKARSDANRRSLILDIAHGLEYLHTFEPPVIHGDLRGPNILITLDKRACIADFGLCTLASTLIQGGDSIQFTPSSSSFNTTNELWLAPEFFKPQESGKETPQQSLATDVYSFACVCYEIFAGHARFSDLRHFFQVVAAVTGNLRPSRPSHEDLDDAMWKLMDDCWANDAEARPTAVEIVKYLVSHPAPGRSEKVPLKPTQPLSSSGSRPPNSMITQYIIIALVGPTGSGKSHFINTATKQSAVVVGNDLESCTQDVQAITYPHPDGSGRRVVLVDTPGFDDTERTDYQVLELIANWMKETYQEHITLTGLLFFHRITDGRMRGTPLRNLKMFEALCGKEALENVVLMTTMWDEVNPEVGVARETELQDDFWAPVVGQGRRTARFYNTFESAWEAINLCSTNCPQPLQLQRELGDQRKELKSTTAFLVLKRWWEEVWAKLKGKSRRWKGKQPST
ncbi:putative protein with domain-containing protein [Lyophyllum shimeji]|uniref:Protein kinase domain-containing protein n=1 Tax=Lyophyllum shimeji TaxID=47721 RepID=A0A9P3PQD4_LYOSH|nr:putative protein with domain-containing protein [Lyophyllum shimeji]